MVVAAGRRPWRLERALEAGADAVVDAVAEDAPDKLRELTDGGADLVIECVGTPEAWSLGLAIAARGSTVLAIIWQTSTTFSLLSLKQSSTNM